VINNQNVKVAWTDPVDNFEAIDGYMIYIVHSDYTTYSEVVTYCDGSNSVTFDLQACEIPLTVLEVAPYSLGAGNQIIAVFQAHNSNGWGPISYMASSGA
jgi:hypothetical protein